MEIGNKFLTKLNYNVIDYFLGSGKNGSAFKIKNEELAIKVTSSPEEAKLIYSKLLNHTKTNIVKYHTVYKVNVPVILQDKYSLYYKYVYCIILELVDTKKCWISPVFQILNKEILRGKLSKEAIIKNEFINKKEINNILVNFTKSEISFLYDEIMDSYSRDVFIELEEFIELLDIRQINKIGKNNLPSVYEKLVKLYYNIRGKIDNSNYTDIFDIKNLETFLPEVIEEIKKYVSFSDIKILKMIDSFIQMYDDTESLGIRNYDLHSDNVGIKENEFKMFDPMDVTMRLDRDNCPTLKLEKNIKDIINEIIEERRIFI